MALKAKHFQKQIQKQTEQTADVVEQAIDEALPFATYRNGYSAGYRISLAKFNDAITRGVANELTLRYDKAGWSAEVEQQYVSSDGTYKQDAYINLAFKPKRRINW